MKNRLPFFLLLLLLFGIYWQWWLPGPRVSIDLPIVSHPLLKFQMDLPRTWSAKGAEGLGEYAVFTLWSWPLTFISGFLANFGLGFAIQERILELIPILLISVWGIWKLGERINLSNPAKLISSLFYLVNTYIFLVIDGGQLSIGLAYAWFPVGFLAIEKSINGGLRGKILAGLAVSILGFFDIRFVYVLLLLLALRFFYEFLFLAREKWIFWISSWAKSGIFISLIFTGLNFYWVLPAILAPILSSTFARLIQTSFLSFSTMGHSILMLAPHWFKNVFGKITPLRWEFVFIPILVFLAPIFKKKDRWVGFWTLVALLAIFLTKGALEPLPQVYPWLFTHIPGFSLFRDPTKFFFLTALSYSVLIGITVNELVARFPWSIRLIRYRISLISLLTAFYLIWLVRPVYLGQMTGTFSQPPLQKEYFQLADFLSNQREFFRTFWIPTKAPLGYSSPNHPAVEASRFVQKRPFAAGTVGTYELFNFLREAPYMGELFDIAGIRYIIYPFPDTRREELKPDNVEYYYTFLSQIAGRDWVTPVATNSAIPLVQVNQHQDHFFVAPNAWLVVGSDDIYRELVEIPGFRLSDNALIFVEEQAGLGQRMEEIQNVRILLNKKGEIDLAASFLQPNELIFPARQLNFDPNETGWWKREAADLISWRAFLQEEYGIDNLDFDLGGGWSVGEGNVKLQISNVKLQEEDSILLARVLESTKSGELVFRQADKVIGKINTEKKGDNVGWFEVGSLPITNQSLIIEAQGDINVVNALAMVDKKEWEAAKKKALQLIEQGQVFVWSKLGDNGKEQLFSAISKPKVSYTTINPTKYKVSVSGLENPAILVFSETYDGLWGMEVSGRQVSSLPLYSLINGFPIQTDGEYVIEFFAQRYVLPGLVVSGTTLILALLILFLV